MKKDIKYRVATLEKKLDHLTSFITKAYHNDHSLSNEAKAELIKLQQVTRKDKEFWHEKPRIPSGERVMLTADVGLLEADSDWIVSKVFLAPARGWQVEVENVDDTQQKLIVDPDQIIVHNG